MRRTVLATLAVLTAIGMLPTASAQSNTFAVDCNRGQTITQALRQGDFRQPLVINVRGTCREFLNITRANVTLRGTPEAEIMAPDNAHDLVTISADKVTLENLTLTGGLTGLTVNHEPTFIAQEVTVQDTSGVGVRVRVGDARLISCTVQRSGSYGIDVVRGGSVVLSGGSQVMDNVGAGINAARHGLVNVNNSTVMRNGAQGIVLAQGSQGFITNQSTIAENAGNGIDVLMSQANITGGNTIRDNFGFGIAGHGAPITIDENTITRNKNDGVIGYIGTTLVLHGNTISENNGSGVRSMGNSLVQISGATIENNASNGITLVWGAKLILEAPATRVSGSYHALYCADNESSYAAMAPLETAGLIVCTGFDN